MAESARTPRQNRSRETQLRLEAAAFEVISEGGLEAGSVAEIARRADTSVGNVYRRFASKEALLDHLEVVFLAGRDEFWREALRSERWAERTLEEFIAFMVQEIVVRHREHEGFLRAIALRARQSYEERVRAAGPPWKAVTALVRKHWVQRIRHADPDRAVALGMEMVSATAGELILFRGHAAKALRLNDRVLITELSNAVMAYLTRWPADAHD